jgi:spoIIIJ-associated protein
MEIRDIIQQFVDQLSSSLHIECQADIQVLEEGGRPVVRVSLVTTDQARFLIGTQGENLRALEHVLRLTVARHHAEGAALILDINDYKKSRALQAVEVARAALQRVRATGKPEALPPMTAFERRAVHTELMAHPDIATESIGEEPQRRVVIKLS